MLCYPSPVEEAMIIVSEMFYTKEKMYKEKIWKVEIKFIFSCFKSFWFIVLSPIPWHVSVVKFCIILLGVRASYI